MANDMKTYRHMIMEECIQIATELSIKHWQEYKHGNSPARANPYYEGLSDGAELVANTILQKILEEKVRDEDVS